MHTKKHNEAQAIHLPRMGSRKYIVCCLINASISPLIPICPFYRD